MNRRLLAFYLLIVTFFACNGPVPTETAGPQSLEQQLVGSTSDTGKFRLNRALARRLKSGDKQGALEHAEGALAAAKASGRTDLVFLAEELRGEVLMATMDTAAVSWCARLIGERKNGNDPIAYARAHVWLGNALARVNRNVEADSVLALALELLQGSGDTLLIQETTVDRMGFLGLTGRPDEAIRLGNALLAEMPLEDACAVHARLMAAMGTSYYYLGRIDTAVTWQKRAIAASEVLADTLRLIQYLGNLSGMATMMNDYRTALDAQNRQVAMAERFGLPQQVASGLISQGITCDYMLRFDDALSAYDRGLRLADSLKDERLVFIGSVAKALVIGKMDSAHCARHHIPFDQRNRIVLEQLRPWRGKYAAMGEIQREASLEHNLGDLLLLEHKPDSAKACFDRAMAMFRSIGDDGGIGRVSIGLGNLAFEQKNDPEATRLFTTALEVMKTMGSTEQVAFLENALGELDDRNGRPASAVGHLREARRLSEMFRMDSSATAIADLRAQFEFNRQHFADSLAHENELIVQRTEAHAKAASQRKTLWMTIGTAVLLLLGTGIYFLLDRRRKKERHEKDAALLETQALRSQMNPHFIFNALNSINAYVQTNEAGKASDYLAQFARLMRMVLENSRHAEVPLKDDLDALRAYFELERARTNEKFDYSIEVDPAIDQENVLVPPLVLQPFVENAIWHGMAGRTEKGHITLKVTMRGDPASGTGDLIMAVEDDGGGRHAKKVSEEAPDTAPRTAPNQGGSGDSRYGAPRAGHFPAASKEIPDNAPRAGHFPGASTEIPDSAPRAGHFPGASGKKTSLGTEITRGRLDLVAKQKGRPAGFKYVDLEKGTRVEVTLPATLAA